MNKNNIMNVKRPYVAYRSVCWRRTWYSRNWHRSLVSSLLGGNIIFTRSYTRIFRGSRIEEAFRLSASLCWRGVRLSSRYSSSSGSTISSSSLRSISFDEKEESQ